MLLPPSLEEIIPEGHLVRIVDEMIEGIDLSVLEEQYKGGGTSAYHPKMMLKVLIYAYTQRAFSSRRIAKELRENINYMWLSGMSQPDHRTINRFRGVIMKEVIEEVFYGIIEELIDLDYISLEKYFVDGTKIEANANRYSFVWKKSTEQVQGWLAGESKSFDGRNRRLGRKKKNRNTGKRILKKLGREDKEDQRRKS